jgi:hypothetical protein
MFSYNEHIKKKGLLIFCLRGIEQIYINLMRVCLLG